jgi:hypothetical protein
MMSDNTLEYQQAPVRRKALLAAIISIGCLISIPLGFFVPLVFLPLTGIGFSAGVFAVVASRGRSIMGWIGLTIHGFFAFAIAMVILMGR